MQRSRNVIESRRLFLRYLAASPALAYVGLSGSVAEALVGVAGGASQSTRRYAGLGDVISSPEVAIDIFDFETVARNKLPPAHWGYLATGVDNDATIQANRDGFSRRLMAGTTSMNGVESVLVMCGPTVAG